MSRPAIITRNLGKKFIIPRNKSDELKDYLILDYMKNRYKPSEIFNRLFNKNKYEEVWAIRNISFDLEKGSVVGLIGKNGAGKKHPPESFIKNYRSIRRRGFDLRKDWINAGGWDRISL